MRATEEREVEADSALKLERESELVREDEEQMPALDAGQELDAHREGRAIDAMRAILERRQVIVNDLKLPKRQLEALEAFKAAVSGRDGDLNQFVYAVDRRALLEEALAILQPELVRDFEQVFAELVHRISGLRGDLRNLEDSEDTHLIEGIRHLGHAEGDAETADKPAPDPGDTSLDGPERIVSKPPTSLTGAELKEPPAPPSTAYDPTPGPEPKLEPKGPTTLGDAEDLAAAGETIVEPQKQKSKPWWRRAFGKD